LEYNGYSIAEVSITGLHGRTGIGVAQLGFSIDFRFIKTEVGEVTVREPRIEVHAVMDQSSATGTYLGQAIAEAPFEVVVHTGHERNHLIFRLSLSDGQILELEKRRSGRDLRFELKVATIAYGRYGVRPMHDTLQYRVNVSEWAQVLSQLEGPEYLIIGLGLPRCAPDHPLRAAVERVRHAHASFVLGRYDSAIADCRIALDSALATTDDRKEMFELARTSGASENGLSKAQRELMLINAVRNYTHLAHHVDRQGQLEYFSRDDASMILSTTAALLASVLARPPSAPCGAALLAQN
jgi:hypothetical protein